VHATRSSISVYAVISSCFLIGNLGLYTIPLFVEPLLSAYRINESGIGMAVGASALGMVISTLLISGYGKNFGHKSTVMTSLLLILAGQALVAASISFPLLLLGRLAAGMGEGAVLAFAYRAGASLDKPERAYGVAQLVVGILTVASLAVFPDILGIWGLAGGILAYCLIISLAGVVVISMRHGGASPAQHGIHMPSRYSNKLLGIGLLVAFALFASSDVSTWVFVEKIGLRAGLSAQQMGYYLGIAVAFGLFGPLFAIFAHTKFGRYIPIVLGSVILLLAISGLYFAASPDIFFFALLPLNFGFMFMTPYLLGALAAVDTDGAWVSLSASTNALTAIIAPPVAGLTIENYGLDALSLLALSLVFLGALINLMALRSPALRSNEPVFN
jgi:predicted MFS family arabinose efflux permease